MPVDKKTLGGRIRKLRELKHLTQEELGDMIDSDGNTVSRWETGKLGIGNSFIVKLARALDTSTDYILIGDASQSENSSSEANNPERKLDDSSIDSSFTQKGDFIGSGKVLFYRDGDKQFVLPATPEAQTWFQKFIENLMLNRAEVHAS